MNLIELNHALRQLRLGGMAAVLETRLHQAQSEAMAPIDLISILVSDELTRRGDRLLERRRKQAGFRDPHKTLDNFDFVKQLYSRATRCYIARPIPCLMNSLMPRLTVLAKSTSSGWFLFRCSSSMISVCESSR